MASDDLKAFLSENALKAEDISYVASKRFLDKDRKPIPWRIHVINSEELDRIRKRCTKKQYIPGTRETQIVTDNDKFTEAMVCETVTYPNLNDAGLQTSYNAIGAEDLIHKMLTPGEYTDLANAVQQALGYEVGMDEKIEHAKK